MPNAQTLFYSVFLLARCYTPTSLLIMRLRLLIHRASLHAMPRRAYHVTEQRLIDEYADGCCPFDAFSPAHAP